MIDIKNVKIGDKLTMTVIVSGLDGNRVAICQQRPRTVGFKLDQLTMSHSDVFFIDRFDEHIPAPPPPVTADLPVGTIIRSDVTFNTFEIRGYVDGSIIRRFVDTRTHGDALMELGPKGFHSYTVVVD